MPKNRQKSAPIEPRDGKNRQETAHSNCYISLAWCDHSPTVQLGTIRPDGIVAEHVEHDADSPVHVIADGTLPDQANEPGWFVHLDEDGLKQHIQQCRRAGRRVFGWGKRGDGGLPAVTANRGGMRYPARAAVTAPGGWCASEPPAGTPVRLHREEITAAYCESERPHAAHIYAADPDTPHAFCGGATLR